MTASTSTNPLPQSRRDEIRKLALAATPGPWIWPKMYNNSTLWANHGQRLIVMDAIRHGMNSACIRFRDHAKCLMVKAVDIEGLHPDKDYIAALSPDVALSLLDAADRVEELEREVAELKYPLRVVLVPTTAPGKEE